MTGKIFRNALLVGILVLVFSAALFSGVLFSHYEQQVYSELEVEANYISHGMELSGETYLKTLKAEARVTWVGADGTVRYDSVADAASMENHLNRTEIADALKNGSGKSAHYSETLLERTLYYAVRMDDGTVLRVSCTQSSVAAVLVLMISPTLWVIVLMLLLSAVLSFRLAKQITKPINAIDLDDPETPGNYQELMPLVDKIRDQNRTIRNQMEELGRRQQEFTAVSDNMSEGFLLLDGKMNLLSANRSAMEHLDSESAEQRQLLRAHCDPVIYTAAETALSGTRSEQLLHRDAATYQVIASPVTASGQVSGAAVLLMDVTEREQREALRREFSANVSHELKTPLTSISGFAELMKQGLVPPDKAKEFAGDIYRESRRLIDLVDDIINLSRLDENTQLFERESVDLYELSEDVESSLASAAAARNVSLHMEGSHQSVSGVWQILNEMVYNLCDNAIKYNREGGSVTIRVDEENGRPRLCVSDTGIGIPLWHQSRVFERFYRVDKSHSKAVGGTGLGLSIVKHGAQYHNAKLSLESEPGRGTKITLLF